MGVIEEEGGSGSGWEQQQRRHLRKEMWEGAVADGGQPRMSTLDVGCIAAYASSNMTATRDHRCPTSCPPVVSNCIVNRISEMKKFYQRPTQQEETPGAVGPRIDVLPKASNGTPNMRYR